MIKKRLGILVILIMTVLISAIGFSSPESPEKTIIVSVDRLDFDYVRELGNGYSQGLISLKAGGGYESSLESQFLTMATGRRVFVEPRSFEGIEKDGEKLKIKGYSKILEQLDSEYKNFSSTMEFLGESLNENGIKTSYIGDREDVLLVADKSGEVDFGETDIEYSERYLNEKMDSMLEQSDLLLVSYDINEDDERLKLLSKLVSERPEEIIIFPRAIEGDIGYRLNRTIAPIVYKNNSEGGILTSDSTKREGIVSNLDLMVTLLEKYGIEQEYQMGNPIKVEPLEGDRIGHVKGILLEFLNLNIIKYVFHGVVISIQLLFIVSYLLGKRVPDRYKSLILIPMVSVLMSLVLGLTPLSKHLSIYIAAAIAGSAILSGYFKKRVTRGSDIVDYLAIATNLFILVFLYMDKDVLYNSFIGYNNIVAAGRFYGFNNDIMGVFIGTGILAYFRVTRRGESRYRYLWILYLVLITISHTESYGNNFGGLLTSTFLMMAILYCEFFCGKNRKGIFALAVLAAAMAIGAIVYVGGEGSHMGEFFIRVREYGFTEFWDMIEKKIRQLVYMIMLPQWGVMVLLQSLFMVKYIRERLVGDRKIKANHIIFYSTALFVLLVNDTGVVSFVYMMMYLVSKSILEMDSDFESIGEEMR